MMTDAAKLLGSRIRLLRKHLGLTQLQVAAASDLSPLGFQKIERGESFPKLSSLESIAKALKVRPIDLMDSENQKRPTMSLSVQEERLIVLVRRCDKKTMNAIIRMARSGARKR